MALLNNGVLVVEDTFWTDGHDAGGGYRVTFYDDGLCRGTPTTIVVKDGETRKLPSKAFKSFRLERMPAEQQTRSRGTAFRLWDTSAGPPTGDRMVG